MGKKPEGSAKFTELRRQADELLRTTKRDVAAMSSRCIVSCGPNPGTIVGHRPSSHSAPAEYSTPPNAPHPIALAPTACTSGRMGTKPSQPIAR